MFWLRCLVDKSCYCGKSFSLLFGTSIPALFASQSIFEYVNVPGKYLFLQVASLFNNMPIFFLNGPSDFFHAKLGLHIVGRCSIEFLVYQCVEFLR